MLLAQINVAKALAPLDSPQLKEFVENLAPVNQTAENSPGFVWRYQDEDETASVLASAFQAQNYIVNMSVWQDVESLKNFMFKTHHLEFMQRKHEWFEKLKHANHALWWTPKSDAMPDLSMGLQRLFYLQEHGESDFAFTFRSKHLHLR